MKVYDFNSVILSRITIDGDEFCIYLSKLINNKDLSNTPVNVVDVSTIERITIVTIYDYKLGCRRKAMTFKTRKNTPNIITGIHCSENNEDELINFYKIKDDLINAISENYLVDIKKSNKGSTEIIDINILKRKESANTCSVYKKNQESKLHEYKPSTSEILADVGIGMMNMGKSIEKTGKNMQETGNSIIKAGLSLILAGFFLYLLIGPFLGFLLLFL